MEFKDKKIIITGCAMGIGKCLFDEFSRLGALCLGIDVYQDETYDGSYYVGDVSKKEVLEDFAKNIIEKYGKVDCIINNAKPIFKGIDECSFEEFNYALNVGVTSAFYLAKLFKDNFNEGASIINISSSRDRMSQGQSESYTAAKGAIHALTHSLAVSLKGKVRVNSVSPGWIDTTSSEFSVNDTHQHLTHTIGKPIDIFNVCKFLASNESRFITAENIVVDGGMTHLMIYHDEKGWKYEN